MKIIPAILPQRYREIENVVIQVNGAVDTVQIDFVDGQFAPNKTWWFNEKDKEVLGDFERENTGLPEWESMNYEFDLMVRDPLRHIDTFTMLGPSKIIFHAESFDMQEMVAYFEKLPEIVRQTITFGLAVGIGTPPEDLAPLMPYIESVQCMGIAAIGFQGQPYDERVLEQIAKVKELYPDKVIAVDGAVSEATIPELARAGVTEFVVGSALFDEGNPRGKIKELNKLCEAATAQESSS